ncbi:MAG: alpha/beta hydrolase [Caulobacteraceae bacterium]
MAAYEEIAFAGVDGAELYARDYGGDGPAVLCMHGLTRNSKDFEGMAAQLSPRWRLIVPDQRGRGRSAYSADPAQYATQVYVGDMWELLTYLGVDRFGVIGTSMGGIMGTIMAAMEPARIWGLVLNDIGAVVDARGIARIKGYVGAPAPAKNWAEAATRMRGINGVAHPDYTDDDWMAMAQRLFREDSQGGLTLAYDPAIAEGMARADVAPTEMWSLFEATIATPKLVIRGELSDLLTAETVAEMQRREPGMEALEVPRVGHTPTLAEPAVVAAIARFLERTQT